VYADAHASAAWSWHRRSWIRGYPSRIAAASIAGMHREVGPHNHAEGAESTCREYEARPARTNCAITRNAHVAPTPAVSWRNGVANSSQWVDSRPLCSKDQDARSASADQVDSRGSGLTSRVAPAPCYIIAATAARPAALQGCLRTASSAHFEPRRLLLMAWARYRLRVGNPSPRSCCPTATLVDETQRFSKPPSNSTSRGPHARYSVTAPSRLRRTVSGAHRARFERGRVPWGRQALLQPKQCAGLPWVLILAVADHLYDKGGRKFRGRAPRGRTQDVRLSRHVP